MRWLFPKKFSPKNYICDHIGQENIDEFVFWAFGKDFENCNLNLIPSKWNEQHPDYTINTEDMMKDSCDKMIDVWKEYKNASKS